MSRLLPTLVALVAFASNSVLCRFALAGQEIGPAQFTAIRVVAGAVTLAALVILTAGPARGIARLRGAASPVTAAALAIYAVGFSYAYVSLATGTGALLLFGTVQIGMFAGALLGGERPGAGRWAGSALGLCGLSVLFLPGAIAPDVWGAAAMVAAAAGWAVFSLRGRRSADPVTTMAGAFLLCVPAAVALVVLAPAERAASGLGVGLAVASGAVASGLGYVVWYSILPRLDASVAAVAQLAVPLLAVAAGAVLLGEPLTLPFALAALLILGGVGTALLSGRR